MNNMARSLVGCGFLLAQISIAAALDLPGPLPRKTPIKEWNVSENEWIRISSSGCTSWKGKTGVEKKLLIFIPGLTMTFVPVVDIAGLEMRVPAELQSTIREVWLASGAFYRDSSREAVQAGKPCERSEHLHLELERLSTGRDALPFTLVYENYDANDLPKNPKWVTAEPDACDACKNFLIQSTTKYGILRPLDVTCTRQRPFVDAGDCQFDLSNCLKDPGTHHLGGHLQWGPASFHGKLCGGSTPCGNPKGAGFQNDDGDIEFVLVPDGRAGTTHQPEKKAKQYQGTIGLEFASAETIKWFFSPWWKEFPYARSSYKVLAQKVAFFERHKHHGTSGKVPSKQLSGVETVAVGMFGLDNEHYAHPELHPVYGIALKLPESGDESKWEVFARSWGTGGSCGTNLRMELDSKELALELPLGALSAESDGRELNVEGDFYDHGTPVENWSVYRDGKTLQLVLPLKGLPYGECGFVEGELRVKRGIAGAASAGTQKEIQKMAYQAMEPVMLLVEPRPQRTWLLGGQGHHCTVGSSPFPKEW